MQEISLTEHKSAHWAIMPDSLESTLSTVERSLAVLAGRPGGHAPAAHTTEHLSGAAILPVRGPIFRYANIISRILGWSTIEDLSWSLNASLSDPKIKRIVLEIDSPGGMVAGVSEFAEAVRNAGKPTVAYVSGMGASAAYWIAAAADQVLVNDTGSLGSIGVVGTYQRKPNDQTEIVSSQSPYKRPDIETDEGRKVLQEHVDSLASVFVGAISKYRKVTTETVIKDFGGGGLLVGQLAVNAGLADSLGSLNSVIKSKSKVKEVAQMNVAQMDNHIRSSNLDAEAIEQFVTTQWSDNLELRNEFGCLESAVSYFRALGRGDVGRITGATQG